MTERPLRIAFIGGRGVGGTYSGIETYYEELGSRLASLGHQVTAYCRKHFTPDVPVYRGIRVRLLPALRNKHLETISHSALATLDCLRHPFDIIQYHAIGSAPLAAIPRVVGRKTIVSVRGLDWQRAKWGVGARTVLQVGEWTSARFPSATAVVSNGLAEHYRRVHRREVTVIPNAIVSPVRRAPDRIRTLGLEKDDYLLFAGRLSPEKGVRELLEAAAPINPGLKIVLAGGSSYSGDYIECLKAMAGPEVLFLGSVDRGMMEELHTNCFAYVLPSFMEGLSISLLEALSYGSCIITTDIPENLEVVGSAALTCRAGDVQSLREALRRVFTSSDVAQEYRRRAAEHAKGQPDWDEVTQRTLAFYRELLGMPSESVPSRRIAAAG